MPTHRCVNLAQPTGLGPGPCGLRPKKPTLKKATIKEVHKTKNPTKALWVRVNPWAFIFNMKNILFFKIDQDKHDDPNRSDDLDMPYETDGPNDPNEPRRPGRA